MTTVRRARSTGMFKTTLVTIRGVSVWLPGQGACRFALSNFAERGDVSVLDSFARAGKLAVTLHRGAKHSPAPSASRFVVWVRRIYYILSSRMPILHKSMALWLA